MVPGSLVSNKQSVNPSIISAHPVYESQRTPRSSRADENKIATRLHNADGARTCWHNWREKENAGANDRRKEP
jgi:hypothetical protein